MMVEYDILETLKRQHKEDLERRSVIFMGVPEEVDKLKNDIRLFIFDYNLVKAENQLLKNELEQVKKERDRYKGEVEELGKRLDEYNDY